MFFLATTSHSLNHNKELAIDFKSFNDPVFVLWCYYYYIKKNLAILGHLLLRKFFFSFLQNDYAPSMLSRYDIAMTATTSLKVVVFFEFPAISKIVKIDTERARVWRVRQIRI